MWMSPNESWALPFPRTWMLRPSAASVLGALGKVNWGTSIRGLVGNQPHKAVAGEDIQRAVGTTTHLADALIQVRQQAFFTDDALAVELEMHERASGHRADEQIVLPFGEQVARVEG